MNRITTAFGMCLMILVMFIALAFLANYTNAGMVTEFFIASSIVFAMILPVCSRVN